MSRREQDEQPTGDTAGPRGQLSAAAVVGAYALAGVAWVLFSDTLVRVLLPGRAGDVVNSVKGVGFVVLTSIVLWGVLVARDRRLGRLDRERAAAIQATSTIFASSPLAIVAADRAGRITAWSPAAERILGWRADEVVGSPATILRPDDPAWVARGFAEVMAGETLVAVPVRYPHRDGRPRELELFAAPLRDETGAVRGAVVVAQDVTEIQASRAERARLAAAIDQAAEAIVVTDPAGSIVYVNPAFERITGYGRDELYGKNPRVLKSGAQDAAFYHQLWQTLLAGRTWRGFLRNRRRDGTLFDEEAAISPVTDGDGRIAAYVAVKRDLTVERALESDLRAEVEDRRAVRAAIAGVESGDDAAATASALVHGLSTLDGVDFASVFHLPADGGPAIRLAGALPGEPDLAGEIMDADRSAYLRRRADEGPWIHLFASEPPPGRTAAEIVERARLTGALYAPIEHGGRTIGVVGGLTCDPDPAAALGRRLTALLEFATHAGPILGAQLAAADDIAARRATLRAVIDGTSFAPVFQPIVRLGDRSVVGYEALTRFRDEVAPGVRFVEAGELGLGLELESACMGAALEASRGLPDGAWLTLNASAALVTSGRLAGLLSGEARSIVVELTEHVAVADYAAIRAAMEALEPGVRLAVDDTGSGYAGLRQVVELRPHIVKLDGGIVRGIDADPVRRSLVAGIVHYAEATGTELVAEGVETEAEAEALVHLGVTLGQGYLFARPAPVEALLAVEQAA